MGCSLPSEVALADRALQVEVTISNREMIRFSHYVAHASSLFIVCIAMLAAAHVSGANATLEHPRVRAALPEFRIIPAAEPEELAPEATISFKPFGRWRHLTRRDNGGRHTPTPVSAFQIYAEHRPVPEDAPSFVVM